MRMSLSLLGWELDVTLGPADAPSPAPDPEDMARDLSGGTLGSDRIDAGPTDRYLGFTNGREDD